MGRAFRNSVVLALIGLGAASLARADENATIVAANPQGKAVSGLAFDQAVEIENGQQDYQVVATAMIRGTFVRPHWNLLFNQAKLAFSSDGRFRVRFNLTRAQTVVRVLAIGPKGELEPQDFRIDFPDFARWVADQKDPLKKRHAISATLGVSFLNYTEALSAPLSQTALTVNVRYLYFLKPPLWDLGFSGYFNAVPLSTNQPGVTARFLGLNGRIGYVLPSVQEPWRLSLMTGFYYTTMMVSNGAFGFQNLMGPQAFPFLRRMLANGDTIGAYFKFSPVGTGFALNSLGNREIAGGLSWSHRLVGRHALSLSMDIADLALTIDDVAIESKSLSLSAGYSW